MNDKKKGARMALCLAMLLLSLLVLQIASRPTKKDHCAAMLDAAVRTQLAFDAVKAERIRRGIPLSLADDPNQTGLIFHEFTGITTTLGSLDAKRTTTNPNMAALIVDMLHSAGIGEGDCVAVNLSGSFPALDIATLCALDALHLRGMIIPSVGASTYGATDPAFTYLDIEHFLYEGGYVSQKSLAFSLGGADDMGLEMPEALRTSIQTRLAMLGYQLLCLSDLDENIRVRVSLFEASGAVKCLINVGGNLPSFGSGSGLSHVEAGILTTLPTGESGNGLAQHYLRRGIPVIHLLNMKGLSARYGLPYDPVQIPAPGDGSIYLTNAPPPMLSWSLFGLNVFALCLMLKKTKR